MWSEVVKLTAPDADGGDGFGGSVAMDENYAVLGAAGPLQLGINPSSIG